MAERSSHNPGKRVRTGCLTCRARRRKCDEGKPVCTNCETKKLNCRYGLNITFVEPKESSVKNHPRSRLRKYAKVRFVGDNQSTGPRGNETDTDVTTDSAIDQPTAVNLSASSRRTPKIYNDNNRFDDSGPKISGNVSIAREVRHKSSEPLPNNISYDSPVVSTSGHNASNSDDYHGSNLGERGMAHPTLRRMVTSEALLGEEHQVNLLSHYRYFVAPAIDLGLGSLYFGIQGLNRSSALAEIQSVILSLARLHQAAIVRNSSEENPNPPDDLLRQAAPHESSLLEDRLTSTCLLMWRNILALPPERWYNEVNSATYPEDHAVDDFSDHQFILSQLSLAAALTSPDKSVRLRFPVLTDFRNGNDGNTHPLHQSMCLLSRAFHLSQNTENYQNQRGASFASVWQSCWDDIQQWYASRPEYMQQIFELAEIDSSQIQSLKITETLFPTIIMTSVCATVANIMHHLSAMLLLQRKPRLVKPRGLTNLSSSMSWHIQRIIGLAASTDESEIWVPIVVAAVIQASKRLSHDGQLTSVIELLQKASSQSGMLLDGEIKKLETACAVAAR